MEVHYHIDRNGCRHISIEGEIELQEDIEYIEEQLLKHKENSKPLWVTFLDANILPASLIGVLCKYQELNTIRINTVKPFLYSYLYKLGIPCRAINIRYRHMGDVNKFIVEEPELKAVLKFLKDLKRIYGYDYTEYQSESIIRRIKICMLRSNIQCFNQFKAEVLKNSELFERLFLYFSINTTEFFRDPEVFKALRQKVVPLLEQLPHIKIWSAGCSTGQEPYSLAIMLKELKLLHKVQIYATDLNPYIVQEAKNGLFAIDDIEGNRRNYSRAGGEGDFFDYFTMKNSYMEINQDIKKKILFFQHSLVGSGILNEFQLILCRNVLIYFNSSLQQSIIKNFYRSLDSKGFIVLGKSEGILHNEGVRYLKGFDINKKIFIAR